DPEGALLGRQGASRSRAPLAAWPCGQPVTAARHDQAPELPGEAGDRSALTNETNERKEGRPHQRASLAFWAETLNCARRSCKTLPKPDRGEGTDGKSARTGPQTGPVVLLLRRLAARDPAASGRGESQ